MVRSQAEALETCSKSFQLCWCWRSPRHSTSTGRRRPQRRQSFLPSYQELSSLTLQVHALPNNSLQGSRNSVMLYGGIPYHSWNATASNCVSCSEALLRVPKQIPLLTTSGMCVTLLGTPKTMWNSVLDMLSCMSDCNPCHLVLHFLFRSTVCLCVLQPQRCSHTSGIQSAQALPELTSRSTSSTLRPASL